MRGDRQGPDADFGPRSRRDINRGAPPPEYGHIPQWRYEDLFEYHLAVEGKDKDDLLSLGYQWVDKPHRLVFNLTRMCADLRDEVAGLKQRLAAAEHLYDCEHPAQPGGDQGYPWGQK